MVVDFIDTAMPSRSGDLILENVTLSPASPVTGNTVQDGKQHSPRVPILAVQKTDGTLLANPSNETLLEVEDELVVIGNRNQLRALEGQG